VRRIDHDHSTTLCQPVLCDHFDVAVDFNLATGYWFPHHHRF
jgi:hypothetical protein